MLLPGVLICTSIYEVGWKLLKEYIEGYRQSKEYAKANEEERKELQVKMQAKTAEQQDEKSKLQSAKIFEALGEAGPQTILQLSILLKKYALVNLWREMTKSLALTSIFWTILTSILSLLYTSGNLMVESGFRVNGYRVIPYHSFSLTLLQSALMIPVNLPRSFSISLILASFESWFSLIPILIGLVAYSLLAILVCKIFRKSRNQKEFETLEIRLMIITAIFMPCKLTNPQWLLLPFLSTLSAVILAVTLAILPILSQQANRLLNPFIIEDPDLYLTTCNGLIVFLIIGAGISFLQRWIVMQNHNTFLFKVIFGETEAVEEMLKAQDKTLHNYSEVNYGQRNALDFAIEMKHNEIIELIRQHGQACGIPPPKSDPNFYNS